MMDLKSCPCCGKPGKLKDSPKTTRRGSFRQGWVGCPDCGLFIQWAHDPGGAIRKWNRRADAPEKPSCHFCPHAIRNVHDRGDDSLCRVLGTEQPKELQQEAEGRA